jgi:hypothetical protein
MGISVHKMLAMAEGPGGIMLNVWTAWRNGLGRGGWVKGGWYSIARKGTYLYRPFSASALKLPSP